MAGFTDLEKRILRILNERPHLRLLQIADKAGCQPSTIYRRLEEKPEFREAYLQVGISGVTGAAPAILDVFTSKALSGSFKHGKLLLEIAGIYQKKQQVNTQISVRDEGPIFKSDRERRDYLRATLDELEDE